MIRVVDRAFLLILAALLGACSQEADSPPDPVAPASKLVLYTSLPADRVAAVAAAYADSSGVVLNYMLESDEVLIDKLIRKEHIPGADVLLVTGGGNLARAVDTDVLRPAADPDLGQAIPRSLRDPDRFWYGVGFRAQAIVYDDRVVDASMLRGYAELGDAEWLEKLCLQRSISERSRSLVAALIAEHGERQAEVIVRGWRTNLAQSVFDEQRELLEAIEQGSCAVGVVGSDVLAGFIADGAATHLRHYFPTAEYGGTQLQPLAAGISRHANDPDGAIALLRWLVSEDGQRALHQHGFDYPSIDDVEANAPVNSWPLPDESPIGPSRSGYLFDDAVLLVERARYR